MTPGYVSVMTCNNIHNFLCPSCCGNEERQVRWGRVSIYPELLCWGAVEFGTLTLELSDACGRQGVGKLPREKGKFLEGPDGGCWHREAGGG